MNAATRSLLDKLFSMLTTLSVVGIGVVLICILYPMIKKGATAVFFDGTVEFRKMQLAKFDRGDIESLNAEIEKTKQARKFIYDRINTFSKGINAEKLTDEVRSIYREYGHTLRYKGISGEEYSDKRSKAKKIRDLLSDAFESVDKSFIQETISSALEYKDDKDFKGTEAEQFFTIAESYGEAIKSIDLSKKEEYAENLTKLNEILHELLGPNPNEDMPSLSMYQYAATRMDMAEKALHKLIWAPSWVEDDASNSLVKIEVPRKQQFAGTMIEPIFDYIPENIDKLLMPKSTFYWQFFIDDSTPGHYFGGVGPEILGTILITILSMVFAIPLGIISAAYLVECGGDNIVIKIIRMCINSLAGVPSIVFGLFGLAFFVLYFLPLFGAPSEPSILAASLTLSLLALPVIIRASEEAIRAVPRTYKEASLGLGAGKFSTFVKVTLPAALPGILTGVILSLSRVAGETAPILFTGAIALGKIPSGKFWFLQQTRTLSYGSYDMAVGDRISTMVPHNQYGMVVTLILLILCLNAFAIIIRTRISKKLQGH